MSANIQIVGDASFDTHIWEEKTEALLFKRDLRGDFRSVALRLADAYCKKRMERRIGLFELQKFKRENTFSPAETQALSTLIEDSNRWGPISLQKPGSRLAAFLRLAGIDRFHYDTNSTFNSTLGKWVERAPQMRIMSVYTGHVTEYKDDQGKTRRFSLGDVWAQLFTSPKDHRNALYHRRPPVYWEDDVPRLSLQSTSLLSAHFKNRPGTPEYK